MDTWDLFFSARAEEQAISMYSYTAICTSSNVRFAPVGAASDCYVAFH